MVDAVSLAWPPEPETHPTSAEVPARLEAAGPGDLTVMENRLRFLRKEQAARSLRASDELEEAARAARRATRRSATRPPETQLVRPTVSGCRSKAPMPNPSQPPAAALAQSKKVRPVLFPKSRLVSMKVARKASTVDQRDGGPPFRVRMDGPD